METVDENGQIFKQELYSDRNGTIKLCKFGNRGWFLKTISSDGRKATWRVYNTNVEQVWIKQSGRKYDTW